MFDLTPEIRALVLDMDGVLWRGEQPIGNLEAIFKQIRMLNLKVVLATNNSALSREQFQQKLAGLGAEVHTSEIINSALVATYVLHKQYPQGGPVYVVGEEGLVSTLASQGFFIAERDVLAVVAGIDRQLTYQKLSTATRLIRNGAQFIGTNADKTYPMPDGLVPGAGSILAALEAATDIKPRIVGKPNPTMMEMIIEQLKLRPQEILTVGDRLDTDIAGGQVTGCRTALVLSGVTTREQAEKWTPLPDIISANLSSLLS